MAVKMKSKPKAKPKSKKAKKYDPISKRLLEKLESQVARLRADVKHYKDLGQQAEVALSSIDNLVTSKTVPNYSSMDFQAPFDKDYDPEGVYNRVKWYVLSREENGVDT